MNSFSQQLVDAARGDIPERFALPIGTSISPEGDEAIVLHALNDLRTTNLEFAHLKLESGEWLPRITYTTELGVGASSLEGNLWVIYIVERAPTPRSRAVIDHCGERIVAQAENRFVFAAVWGQKAPAFDSPDDAPLKVVAFEERGDL